MVTFLLQVAEAASDGIDAPNTAHSSYHIGEFDPASHGVSIIRGLTSHWAATGVQHIRADQYRIEELPRGYQVAYTERSNRLDWYQFGHPSGYRYDSWKKFAVHYAHLLKLSNGEDSSCQCVACQVPDRVPRVARQVKPGVDQQARTRPPRERPTDWVHKYSLLERTNLERQSTVVGFDGLKAILSKAARQKQVNMRRTGQDDLISIMREKYEQELTEEGNEASASLESRFVLGIDLRIGELVIFKPEPYDGNRQPSEWLAGVIVKVPNRSSMPLWAHRVMNEAKREHAFHIQLLVDFRGVPLTGEGVPRKVEYPPQYAVFASEVFPFQLLADTLDNGVSSAKGWHPSMKLAYDLTRTASLGLVIGATCPSWPGELTLQHDWVWVGPQRIHIGDAVVFSNDGTDDVVAEIPVGATLVMRVTTITSRYAANERLLRLGSADRLSAGTHHISGIAYSDRGFSTSSLATRACTENELPVRVGETTYSMPKSMQDPGRRTWHEVRRADNSPTLLEASLASIRGRLLHSTVAAAYAQSGKIQLPEGDDLTFGYAGIVGGDLAAEPGHIGQIRRNADGLAYFESRAEQLGIHTFNRQPCTQASLRTIESAYGASLEEDQPVGSTEHVFEGTFPPL